MGRKIDKNSGLIVGFDREYGLWNSPQEKEYTY